MKVYEHAFNENEWFIIGSLIGLHAAVWLAPKIFRKLEAIAFYFFGVNTVLFFDHTISVKPWDFYDVNDDSSYQFIDFLSYISYGPYSYFFIYFYVKLRISGKRTVLYIVLWSAISVLMEWIGLKLGMMHYDKGYEMKWSFPIYLFVQSMLLVFYHLVKKKKS
ncbi:hypothetical protein [Bacillus sp. ISL-45]|uniref:hypothetical protein n=1 Tax=Bacillus sp. ISL-45 TaxID=2819128 RepID=UPI001BE792AB|nr:hypothetical protein [Bacillus sp. ISL-45]MBT2659615.1 hypothetical protein [Bacillus sp. ISL-45]